jgi:site-specific recombinase XerD
MTEITISSSPTRKAKSPLTGRDNVQERQEPGVDLLALPERINELPVWIRIPLSRFLRLKQRNWPAKTVRKNTLQIYNRLSKVTTFFFQNYSWHSWEQLSLRWLDDYVDDRLRAGLAPSSINWDLINFRGFCIFLIDEGYKVPEAILMMKTLTVPRRLPRPLSMEQVSRLEHCIQTTIVESKTDAQRQLAIRDLVCFYLLWHSGLRNSEVCSLLLSDLDLEGRKLFIRDSKERKDRLVYMSDTTVKTLRHYLAIRPKSSSSYLFPTHSGHLKRGGLWKRIHLYSQQCNVPVTPQRLRHTFASQMLTAGVPVTSLQHYLGHELLDTTMIYAEVSDPLLQQDYYQGITAIDPSSVSLAVSELNSSRQELLRQLLVELKTPDLEPIHQKNILDQMQRILEEPD